MAGSYADGKIDESLLRRFESALSAHKPEPIEKFLPAEDDPRYLATLEELVCLELEGAWKAWSRVRRGGTAGPSDETIEGPPQLESYLRRFPQLDQPEILWRLVAREYAARKASGQEVSVEEYQRRFSELEIQPEDLESTIPRHGNAAIKHSAETLAFDSSATTVGSDGKEVSFGNYDLLEEIGHGGMGIVYRARQRDANRIVALKMIRNDLLVTMPFDTQQTAVDRFHHEAQAAARLEHEHIVTVYEVGEINGQSFYSMRYVEGRSLSEILQDGPIANRRAVQYMEPVARAVDEAHRLGILHRDLKPQNILVDSKTDRAMVADFGLAKLTEGPAELTRAGEVMGTPQYMSPEQAMDSASVDAASDIYGLGASLYHILTGRPPFRAATPVETLRQVIDEEPAPPRQVNPSIDLDLDTICLKCLEKEPSKRYETAGLLADDLRRYLNGEPILARPIGPLQRMARWARRNPVVASLAALAVTCLVLALVATSIGYVKTSAALAKSEESHKQLADGVDKFFGAVMDETLLNEPGMAPLRKKLLNYAMPHYEKFLRERGDDPEIQDQAALAHYRLGKINELIDAPEKALVSYQSAREIQSRLVAERPEDRERLEALSNTLTTIGVVLQDKLKKHDDARKVYEEAVAVRQRLVSAAPEDRELQRKLANAQMNIGIIDMERGRLEEAGKRLEEAHEVRVALLADDPLDRETRRDLGIGSFNLANLAVLQRNYAEAEKRFSDAITTFEALLKNRKSFADQARLAACYRRLADLKCGQGDPKAGFDLYNKAIGLLKTLAVNNPMVPKYRADLATIHMQIGMAENRRNDPQTAMQSFKQARELLEKLVAEYPSVPEYRYNLAGTLAQIGEIDLLDGKGDFNKGLAQCEYAINLLKGLVSEKPDMADYRANLAQIHLNIGMAQYKIKHLLEAQKSAEQARELLETLVEKHPDTLEYRDELTSTLLIIGRVQASEGTLPAAKLTLEAARSHAADLVKRMPDNSLYQQRLAMIEKGLSSVTAKLKQKK
ncbi:MAG: protein kinase [Pirellulales bacterium]|nr:protein kinase [Pirellulales bacterium]